MKTLCLKLSLLVGALLTVSCTFDSDESMDCLSSVTVRLSYVDKTGTPHLDDELNNTDIYLFASDDTFIRKCSFNRAQSIDPAGIQMVLPTGEYRIVTWGNVGTRSGITPANPAPGTPISAFFLSNSVLNTDLPTSDTIFYNSTGFKVKGTENQVIPVPLRRETCYIHVSLEGYDPAKQPYIRLTNLTNGYNFLAQVQGTTTNYKPAFIWNPVSGEYLANFAILRPKDTDQIHVDLYDNTQNAPIMTLDLNVPLKAQNVDLEMDTEPELSIKLGVLDSNRIAVSVNNWNTIVNIHVEL